MRRANDKKAEPYIPGRRNYRHGRESPSKEAVTSARRSGTRRSPPDSPAPRCTARESSSPPPRTVQNQRMFDSRTDYLMHRDL